MVDLRPCPFCGSAAQMMGGPAAQEWHSVWCTGPGCNSRMNGTMDAGETADKWNRRTLSTITPAEVGGQDDDTELMHRLVAEYGGHSVTIVRGGQRLIGWSTSRSVAIADLREIVTSTALATERAAHAETKRELDEAMTEHTDMMWQRRRAEENAEAAEARVAELEKALEPFAKACARAEAGNAHFGGIHAKDVPDSQKYGVLGVTWGHLRAARRALEGGE